MRTRIHLLGLVAVLTGSFPGVVEADTGAYLDFAGRSDWVNNTTAFIGPEGVPQVRYSWGTEDNPVTVSLWALQHWSRWTRTHEAENLEPVITAAEWLIGRQRVDGGWEYLFDFNASGLRMRAPWISAMAQGLGISVLVRAHEVSGDTRYLDGALLALEPFTRTTADGGVAAEWDEQPWYEEYPGVASQHVLNGYEFALLGLHDLVPRSELALTLWDAGVASLSAKIGVFDAPAQRSQFYAGTGGGHWAVDGSYKHEHAILTREIARLTGIPVLAEYAAKWEQYEKPLPVAGPLPVMPPQPGVTPGPVIDPEPVKTPRTCLVRARPVERRHVTCRTARRVLRRYLETGHAPPRWRCRRRTRTITCRAGDQRLGIARIFGRGQDRQAGSRTAARSASTSRAGTTSSTSSPRTT